MKNNITIILSIIILAGIVVFAVTKNDTNTYIVEHPSPVPNHEQHTDVSSPVPTQESNQPQNSNAIRFQGTISAVNTGCFADGICSATIDGKTVILVTGSRLMANQTVGSLQGVASIGDLEQKIGAHAEVYAQKVSATEYTLYGNSSYYVRVK